MARKKSSKSSKETKKSQSGPNIILAGLMLVIGFIIYAVSGVDFFGVVNNGTPDPNATSAPTGPQALGALQGEANGRGAW